MISICSRITQGTLFRWSAILFTKSFLFKGRGDSASFASKVNSGALSAVFGDSKQELIKQQDRRLHLRALCILTAIIQSLVTWTKDIDGGKKVTSDDSSTLASTGNNADDDSTALEANPVVVGKNPLLAVSMKQVGQLKI